MDNQLDLPKDGKTWWKKRGIEISLCDGEKINMAPGSDAEKLLASQEAIDARRLIQLGNSTKDDDMKRIGQQRLRIVLGKTLPEDLD